MYTKDGESYWVVDGHTHLWDASPANWVEGKEEYAKGWIECFHAYQSLGPADTHWTLEHFEKYSEDDFMKDVFQDGYVDVAIFQPTYLTEWYKNGFNTTETNSEFGLKHPGKFLLNTRWDPREGDAGLKQLAEDVSKYGCKGCKLYTAEWRQGSRGWTLKDPEAYKFLEKCEELGVKNIHVHKGPTIWPLDKDAFDVSDVDHAATRFQGLNFIVEGFAAWDYPDDTYSDYPRLTPDGKRKIFGLNAAKLYDLEIPAQFKGKAAAEAAQQDSAVGVA